MFARGNFLATQDCDLGYSQQKESGFDNISEETESSCCLPFRRKSSEDFEACAVSFESGNSDIHWEDINLIDAELGLAVDHFSYPEGHFGFSAIEELEMAIENCKEMIMESKENTDKRKKLVIKLVQLRLKLQEIKDGTAEPISDVKLVLGHKFELRSLERPQQYCEKCCKVIWGVLNGWYSCKECGYKCHGKCLNLITRTCASIKVLENPNFILDICPEEGLSFQNYRCAECKKRIVYKDNYYSPRKCDYNGLYYCSFCHWNSQSVIPARIIHNWDFEPRKVCRASLQFLRLMMKKPVLNIESLNPVLFSFVVELTTVKRIREEILMMKQYFLTCHSALESRLLLELKDRQHFVESPDVYSLQDLVDLESGNLMIYLENIRRIFAQHITQDCQGCQGKGFICELCKSEEILFPFDHQTAACAQCSSLFHRECYTRKDNYCPRCERRSKANEEIPSL